MKEWDGSGNKTEYSEDITHIGNELFIIRNEEFLRGLMEKFEKTYESKITRMLQKLWNIIINVRT